jgi:hypothetical protein
VVQTTRLEDLRALAEFPGPGIGAVLPEGCATFVHDPQRGPRLSQRLAVTVLPEPLRVAAAGGSLRQQGEELAAHG